MIRDVLDACYYFVGDIIPITICISWLNYNFNARLYCLSVLTITTWFICLIGVCNYSFIHFLNQISLFVSCGNDLDNFWLRRICYTGVLCNSYDIIALPITNG